MESFNIPIPPTNETSFGFNSEDFIGISCPDKSSILDEGLPEEPEEPEEDNIELPLPPGTSGDDFPFVLTPKQMPTNFDHPVSKSSTSEYSSNGKLEAKSCHARVDDEDAAEQPHDMKDILKEDVANKPNEFFNDSKYSPSKADSDEENQDFITVKPKVLGKEQAKKRLMAFSLSKQPNVAVSKSKTVTPAKIKEKPPNPNKGSNLQDQFRATISAIEEEKKKMFQNMPNYLLKEMSGMARISHSSVHSSLNNLENCKEGNYGKGGKALYKRSEEKRKRSRHRSRSRSISRSRNKKQNRRERRSRSRSKRNHNTSRRRSRSRSYRNRSRSRRTREDKPDNKVLRESQSTSKRRSEDCNSFTASDLNRENSLKPRRNERSPVYRSDFKPIFNYLSQSNSEMTSLQAKPADSKNPSPVLFSGKIIKYTRTKPILCWSENPSYGSEYYMTTQMLLENCDHTTSSILLSIIESKSGSSSEKEDISEAKRSKSRLWYPRVNYLLPASFNTNHDVVANETSFFPKSPKENDEKTEESRTEKFVNKVETDFCKEDTKTGRSLERKISLVNDSYLSEEEDQDKEALKNIKSHFDLDMNRVKVRSRWDSDYEGETSEKDSNIHKGKPQEQTKLKVEEAKSKKIENCGDFIASSCHDDSIENKKVSPSKMPNLSVTHCKSPSFNDSEPTTGNLVSEYEEFLKMVAADSIDNHDNQKEICISESMTKSEKLKSKKSDKPNDENQNLQSFKVGLTDWDRESDREETTSNKKVEFGASHDEFLIFGKNEKLDIKLEKSKNKPTSKKTEKTNFKKKKSQKKFGKAKKKKYEDSVSEETSSESVESDSDSDTDDSKSSSKKKKKKRKVSKTKKKSKKDSSDSESDSDDGNAKKKKFKKKQSGKKNDRSSDESEKTQNALLKQLDFKKQIISKKTELTSERSTKKKAKKTQERKKDKDSSEETDSEKHVKSGKKKKTESKYDKNKSNESSKSAKSLGKNKKTRKGNSSSDSDSESERSIESTKKKKSKRIGKRKRNSSESSSTEEKSGNKLKSSNKTYGKSKKHKSAGTETSDSNTSEDSSRDKKKEKNKENKMKDTDRNLHKVIVSEPNETVLVMDVKSDAHSTWERKKLWKKDEKKMKLKKEDGDWETSTSGEESEQEEMTRESNWDDVTGHESKEQVLEDTLAISRFDSISRNMTLPNKNFTENTSMNISEANKQFGSEALKTSLSNFSFNENSFCSFGQELSRDFFLAERSYSNLGNANYGENLRPVLIEPRPFQSVSKDSESKKPADSELYSPGCSDSELSEPELRVGQSCAEDEKKADVYDPLNCDSDVSADNNDIEVSNIPLPRVSDNVLSSEVKNVENVCVPSSSNSEGSVLKDLPRNETEFTHTKLPPMTSPLKSCFTSSDFTPVATFQPSHMDEKITPTKRQLMSVKGQQRLISKAASVFQDESDEENIEPLNKTKAGETTQTENSKQKPSCEIKSRQELHERDEVRKRKRESRDRSAERSGDREGSRRRSRSRERRGSNRSYGKESSQQRSRSRKRKKSRTPEKREIRSDSFEIEPLKSTFDSNELMHMVQPIPVLTGLEATSSEGLWSRSLAPEFLHVTDNLINPAESFDIYPSEESDFRGRNYDIDSDRFSRDGKSKRERRKSRSRSYSPKKRLRSKSPERRKSPRNRSPRRKSVSPKRRDKSPFSPRRRSPKRKSPSHRYKSSRSPDKKRKSPSRSPRKRRNSPSRRSRSASPRKFRSPKHRDESPPANAYSPKNRFSPYCEGLQNRIPVIGALKEDVDLNLSPSAMRFSQRMPDSSVAEGEMYSSFYDGEYSEEFGARDYREKVGVNNLITVKNHDIEKVNSPERLSLDQRIELELSAPLSNSQSQSDQYQMPNQVCPPFSDMNSNNFHNSYNCDNNSISSDNFYQNQNVQIDSDFNGQYFNGHQQQPQPSYGTFPQYPNSQPVPNSVLQVGNIVEVVPGLQHPPPPPPPIPSNAPQIMQVGNMLQVVPSQKTTPSVPPPALNYGPPEVSAAVKTQKATAVVAPSSIVPTPNPEVILNPLIKAIQLEREKRRKEKEKRKAEREARRKARQLRREAKLMSVNEKLKKSVQNEGLMLGQEVEDDELLDGLDVSSPPIPVEIITISSPSALPPAGKGILITAGFMPKPPSEKKEVKFADGVCPGEGTSTSGGEDIASPPPKPKLPKEKRFKKKKTKVKKKVKVQIIRQIIQEEDDDEDDLSPPPPPPGDPPPVFFARFPFAGDAQFPVYQTQTTTATLTTVQYPTQSFE